ncbi:Putative cytochrome P450 [Septoria linicola]|uniref:Cytochrome P450 n=1 Tax=Septoria linicola TaxID=215465 RepID=A0A9Q9ANF0_9PEZI|nr:putative cytochrome P450 [Septoria linicola]USW51369.1 Putative cytochrome P450 [Septoria linicola]
MPSYTAFALVVVSLYLSTFAYNFIRNFLNARKSGLPYFCVPWDQNHFLWMILSVPLRPHLKKALPAYIWDRLALTVYSFEHTEKLKPYEKYAAPQGNDSTYVMVTSGLYEISTRDPELAFEILKRPRDFVQHSLTTLFMSKFGNNLLSSDGDTWARQRRVVAGTITERISKTVFNESIRQTEGMLAEMLRDGETQCHRAETGKLFDAMKKITINVLSGAGMGESIDWNNNEKNSKAEPGFRMTYIQAVNVVIDAVAGPIILPHWFLDNYPSFLPGHDFLRNVGYAMKEFPIHTNTLLQREKVRNEQGGANTRNNIMSQLLYASESQTKSGERMLSHDEMIGNLFIFTAAGFDTTANTLAYALVLLCRYPEWQDWVCEEVDALLPAGGEERELEYTEIFPKMKRILAVMLETLRLFAPVIHMAKQTKTEQTIETTRGTVWFPKNATVYVNNIGLGLDKSVWRDLNRTRAATKERDSETAAHDDTGPDETFFRPSRWLNSDGTLFQPPRGTFSPWSLGSRVCPGQKMAQVEFSSIFLTLFRRCRIQAVAKRKPGGELENEREVETRLDNSMEDSIAILTLQMRNVYNQKEGEGIQVRLVRRE